MLYGYVPAVVAGFLLTAIPNWTGRLPVAARRWPGCVLLWLAGRVAMLLPAQIGVVTAASIDIAFLVVLLAVACARSSPARTGAICGCWACIGVLIAGNIVFHVETIRNGPPTYGMRIGIAPRSSADQPGRRAHRAELHA